MKNLFNGNIEKEFYLWVDPKNFMTFNNLSLIGHAFSNPIPSESNNPEDNLLFIPNPKYKAGITPYHNNIAKRIRAEYALEIYRPKQYPSRTQALFLCNSIEDANKYEELHKSHTNDRTLVNGYSTGNYIYSIHDSGWFDFLCTDGSFGDEETIKNCVRAYWNGITIVERQLQLYGNPWSQPPTMEVLFYGNLKITEKSKSELREKFKIAYQKKPWEYPKMYL